MAEPGRDPGPPYGFSKADSARIAAVVTRDERRFRNEAPGGRRDPRYLTAVLIPAKTKSGGISAGSQSAPSTSTVTLLIPDTADAVTDGADVAVLNYSTRSMSGAGKLIYLGFFNGKYVIPLADC